MMPSTNGNFFNSVDTASTTGRFIVIFREGASQDIATVRSTLDQKAGLRNVVTSSDFTDSAIAAETLAGTDTLYFEKLGIAVVSEGVAMLSLATSLSDAESPILAIEPEYIAYPSQLATAELSLEYLRGYREAVNHLCQQLIGGESPTGLQAFPQASFQDTAQFTWGLQATRVHTSTRNGEGIKVAVLDTGLDFNHPDFKGRNIQSKAFVNGVTVNDIHGHGTHCAGTVCGPRQPVNGTRRYGVAYEAELFVGKVFNNDLPRPSAPTHSVLAGIEWAISKGCRVVSLSLGMTIDRKVQQYEAPLQRALRQGTLVVAAAGNNAMRPAIPGFVEPPANADAALAVAAVDSRLQIARFSARSSQITGQGGMVNIAAPGVAVFSTVPVNRGSYAFFDGTSMATPHVAGIATLWAQATGEAGAALWSRILQSASPLNLPSMDVGMGMVQAPQ